LLAYIKILHAFFVNSVADLLVLIGERVDNLPTIKHMIAPMGHYEHFMAPVI